MIIEQLYCNNHQIHYIVDELMSSKIPFVLVTASGNAFPYDTFVEAARGSPARKAALKWESLLPTR